MEVDGIGDVVTGFMEIFNGTGKLFKNIISYPFSFIIELPLIIKLTILFILCIISFVITYYIIKNKNEYLTVVH